MPWHYEVLRHDQAITKYTTSHTGHASADGPLVRQGYDMTTGWAVYASPTEYSNSKSTA